MIAQPEHEYRGDESAKREHEGDRDRIGCETSEYADPTANTAISPNAAMTTPTATKISFNINELFVTFSSFMILL